MAEENSSNTEQFDWRHNVAVYTDEELPERQSQGGPVAILGRIVGTGTVGEAAYLTVAGLSSGHYYLLDKAQVTGVERLKRFARVRIESYRFQQYLGEVALGYLGFMHAS